MCIDVRKTCECGTNQVQFHLRDNIMPPQIIKRLFCPECPGNLPYDETEMLCDNGWVIEYDMEIGKTLAAQRLGIGLEDVTPGFLFDQGYACWLELYPGERDDIRQEKAAIMELLKVDQQKYLLAIQQWNIQRVAALKKAGWRRTRQT